jgi:hypothetical protein
MLSGEWTHGAFPVLDPRAFGNRRDCTIKYPPPAPGGDWIYL